MIVYILLLFPIYEKQMTIPMAAMYIYLHVHFTIMLCHPKSAQITAKRCLLCLPDLIFLKPYLPI